MNAEIEGVLTSCEGAAAMLEARGMTSPDKHDLNLAVLGDRVRVAEVGVDDVTGGVKIIAGE